MPWEETENEIRHRLREPEAFQAGSFRYIQIQRSPPINAVIGRLKGEDNTTIQALRFPSDSWTVGNAKAWYEKRKESLTKMAGEITSEFLEKRGMIYHALRFSKKQFTEKSIADWLVAKGYDAAGLKKNGEYYRIELAPESNFREGSLRDIIVRDGLMGTVGMLKSELQKGMAKRVPDRFSLSADLLHELEDIDITEVTLTRSPAVGKMAQFLIVKSADTGEQTYSDVVPLTKIDSDRKQVGGYVLVPDLPDWQGDIISVAEIEKGAHRFLQNLSYRAHRGTAAGLEHDQFDGIGHPVESFVDREGVYGVKNGWFLVTQITDENVWKSVKAGEIIGYSVGGSGTRKKATVNLDGPVAKTTEQTQETEPATVKDDSQDEQRFFQRLKKFFIGMVPPEPKADAMPESEKESKEPAEDQAKEPETEQDVTKTREEEDKQMERLELLKKLDVPHSVIEDFERQGFNVQQAYEAMEALNKAVPMNFSLKNIGYTTIAVLQAVRRGEFGMYPQEEGAPDVRKEQADESGLKVVSPESDVAKLQETILMLTDNVQKQAAALEKTMGELEKVKNARGLRKSSDQVPQETLDRYAQHDDENPWTSADLLDLSLHEAEKVAKSMGRV